MILKTVNFAFLLVFVSYALACEECQKYVTRTVPLLGETDHLNVPTGRPNSDSMSSDAASPSQSSNSRPRCPPNWTWYSGHCYKMMASFSLYLRHADAVSFCRESFNASLLAIDDDVEEHFLRSRFWSPGRTVCIANRNQEEGSSIYNLFTGGNKKYNNWMVGGQEQGCPVLYLASHTESKWLRVSCGLQCGVLCKKPAFEDGYMTGGYQVGEVEHNHYPTVLTNVANKTQELFREIESKFSNIETVANHPNFSNHHNHSDHFGFTDHGNKFNYEIYRAGAKGQREPERIGRLNVTVVNAYVPNKDNFSPTDAYVNVYLNGTSIHTTEVVHDTLYPSWNESVVRDGVGSREEIKFEVMDWDRSHLMDSKHDTAGVVTLTPEYVLAHNLNGLPQYLIIRGYSYWISVIVTFTPDNK